MPGILDELLHLARLPNVAIWLSADMDNWIQAMVIMKDNPEFAGIAFMQTKGSEDIAAIISKSLPANQVVIFPEHKAFGRHASEPQSGLPNCPAITGEIKADKKAPACLQCLKCLPGGNG